jgi:OmpA-OmpF porin, OOP family
MTRSEARTFEAWWRFDRAALFVALAGLLGLLLLWWSGYGPSQPSCCGTPVVAVPPAPTIPAATPAPVAAPAPEPPKGEPTKPEPPPVVAAAPAPAKEEAPMATPAKAKPTPDCGKIVKGVSVQFAFGSAVLSAQGRAVLDRARACFGGGRYEVVGHADSVGDKQLNQRLSEARADAVVAYLRSKGVNAARLAERGYGETKPTGDNRTAQGRAQNRRVTVTRQP